MQLLVEGMPVSVAFNRGARFDGPRFWEEIRRFLPTLAAPSQPPFLDEATPIRRIVSHLLGEKTRVQSPLERMSFFAPSPRQQQQGAPREERQLERRPERRQAQQQEDPSAPEQWEQQQQEQVQEQQLAWPPREQQQEEQQQQFSQDEDFDESLVRAIATVQIAKARSTPAPRFVNTWFESDAAVPPLLVGHWYTFCLDVGPKREDVAAFAPFTEPDFGSHQVLSLRATFFSRELDVERADAVIQLPRAGRSSPARLRVRPRAAGACRLQILLSLERELDVLQSLTVEIDARAGATAPEGAARGAGASP
jgi:hypothetical protein